MPEQRLLDPSTVAVLVLLGVLTCSGCQGERSLPAIDSPGGASRSMRGGSPSGEPRSDVDVQTFALRSREDLFDHLRDVGWTEAVVLRGAEPTFLELWSGDEHWHAQTSYRSVGGRVSVTQAGFEGLPPGPARPSAR